MKKTDPEKLHVWFQVTIDALRNVLPEDVGFTLIIFPFSQGEKEVFCSSNADQLDSANMMRTVADGILKKLAEDKTPKPGPVVQ